MSGDENILMSGQKKNYVYWIITETRNKKHYIGFTNCLNKRIKQHNSDQGARETKNTGPWFYYRIICNFRTKNEALRFEWLLKHNLRKNKSLKNKEDAMRSLCRKEEWSHLEVIYVKKNGVI